VKYWFTKMSKPTASFSKPDGGSGSGNGAVAPVAGAPATKAGSTTGIPQPAVPGTPEKKTPRIKKVRKANPAKVRVKLPPIESYEKELEFSAEGPGRVVVRLERLMGTDRVRILDTRYMTQLLERLEAEEKTGWTKRTRRRKNDERNRFRQLAIEGYMEPDPDMQDLYNHPVFRVNRILNRLARLDNDIGMAPPKKVPPITPCEPLVDGDEDGHIFKTYPGHNYVPRTSGEIDRGEEEEEVVIEDEETEIMYRRSPIGLTPPRPVNEIEIVEPRMYENQAIDEDEEEEEEGATEEKGASIVENSQVSVPPVPSTATVSTRERNSMEMVKILYGVAEDENLEDLWQPYHSELVDLLYVEESEQSATMYEVSKAILGVYKRENMVADDFCIKLNRMM